MSRLRRWGAIVALASVAGLSAAAERPRSGRPAFGRPAWQRAVRATGLDPEEVIYPFAVNPEMVAWTRLVLADAIGGDDLEALNRLQQAMLDHDLLGFSYAGTDTLTAEEAFAAKRGNCLSFTALFVALSRAMGVDTFLVSVRRDPEVDRDQDLVVVNRHVVAGFRTGRLLHLFDFALATAASPAAHEVVDDVRVSAMVHANLGGAKLREGCPEGALPHLRIATTLSPEWSSGWVNLGVARSRVGDVDGAFEAYRRAIEVDPGNSSALTNMSVLYRGLGLDTEARVALLAASRTTASPFTLIALADAAMLSGDLDQAAVLLKRARRQDPDEPEVHEGAARLATRLGDERRAERHLRKAASLRARLQADRP